MRFVKRLILIVCSLAVLLFSYHYIHLYLKEKTEITLHISVKSNTAMDLQLFYSEEKDIWREENSIHKGYSKPGEWESLQFNISETDKYIRLDIGNTKGDRYLKDVYFTSNSKTTISLENSKIVFNQLSLTGYDQTTKVYQFKSMGEDPFLYFEADSLILDSKDGSSKKQIIVSGLLAAIISLSFYFVGRYIRETTSFIVDFFNNRELVLNLAKNDFKTKYASSYLGVLWGFINPLLTIATYWFVFQVGLRNGNVGETPFIIWFIAGIVPWFFFSDSLSTGTNAFSEYSYLVKKVVFKIELLPLVKVISAFFVQLFFIVFIFVIYAIYSRVPSLYNIQLIYYVICLLVLAVSLTFLTSAIVLFFKDLNQIIAVVLQMGFWFTPIGWPVSMLSDFWAMIFKLNPMFYIVQGYRDTFIDHILFFERPYQTFYFWTFCLILLTLGLKVFKKLKPHFSDVL